MKNMIEEDEDKRSFINIIKFKYNEYLNNPNEKFLNNFENYDLVFCMIISKILQEKTKNKVLCGNYNDVSSMIKSDIKEKESFFYYYEKGVQQILNTVLFDENLKTIIFKEMFNSVNEILKKLDIHFKKNKERTFESCVRYCSYVDHIYTNKEYFNLDVNNLNYSILFDINFDTLPIFYDVKLK